MPTDSTSRQVITAARRVIRSALTPLPDSNPSNPVESPVSWVVLAATRRQVRTSPTAPQVTAAAVVNNQPPVVGSVSLGTPSATTGAVTGTVNASDPSGDKLTFKATTSTKGAVSITTAGVFTYTPTVTTRHNASTATAGTALTTDTVTVVVTDTAGATATVGVTVPIAPKNAPPTGTGSADTPNPTTGVVTGKVTGTDADRDPLTYSGSTTTAKGTVTVTSAGAFTYTPTLKARHDAASTTATAIDKTDTFTVTVNDGHGATVAVPVTVTISPKNVAPTGKSIIGPRDVHTGVVTGTVVGADTDADTMTYAGTTTTAKGSVVVNADGSFTYTPTTTARGKAAVFTAPVADKVDTFSVAVKDGHGGTTNVAVTITNQPQQHRCRQWPHAHWSKACRPTRRGTATCWCSSREPASPRSSTTSPTAWNCRRTASSTAWATRSTGRCTARRGSPKPVFTTT